MQNLQGIECKDFDFSGGGCTAPLAVESHVEEETLTLTGGVWSLCGSTALLHTLSTTLPAENYEPPR